MSEESIQRQGSGIGKCARSPGGVAGFRQADGCKWIRRGGNVCQRVKCREIERVDLAVVA